MKRALCLFLSTLMSLSACACQGEDIPGLTGDKELFIVPGATHIRTYFVPEYVDQISAKIQEFFTAKL